MLERVKSAGDRVTGQSQGGEPSWRPLELIEIAPSFAEALSLLRRRRSIPEVRLAGRPLRIATAGAPDVPEVTAPWCATLQVDGVAAEVILPHAFLDVMLSDAGLSIPASAVRPDHAAIFLEFALRDALTKLEEALGCSVSVTSVAEGTGSWASASDAFVSLSLQLQEFGAFWCHVRLEPRHLLALARYLDRISRPPARLMHLPLPVRLRWAMTELTLAELRDLAPGDVILADRSCRQPGLAIAVFAEHLVAPVDVSYAGYRFGAHPRPASGSGWEWALDRHTTGGGDRRDGTASDVPVRLFFELCQFDADDRTLPQAGAVVPLVRALEEGVDIVIDGARIGRGHITTIGEATGIRVTRLAASSRSAQA